MPLDSDDSTQPGATIADRGPTPSRHAIAREEAGEVERFVDRLPDEYRQVLRLRYQEERSFDEIGRIMNRSSNAVRKLWARALERLNKEWDAAHERQAR